MKEQMAKKTEEKESAIAVLVLAAGSSSRMDGRDKLLEEIDGETLLSLQCRRITQAGLQCYVTVPSHDHARAKATGKATVIPVSDANEGMAASIRAGIRALPETIQAVLILPGDMPDIGSLDLLHIAAHFQGPQGAILRATAHDGTPGHPVLFPKRCFDDLLQLTGDQGARDLLKTEAVTYIALPGTRALTDLDTPQAWAAWRAQRNIQT